MPDNSQPRVNTIEVEENVLPAPATKLVITQHLEASQDPPIWAWIIVGAFFDQDDNVLWSTELFLGHFDIQLESDEESESEDSEEDQDRDGDTASGMDFHALSQM